MALSVGLLGFGTVGQSVARLIVERSDGLLTLSHIFNRDVARKRVDWVPSSVVWTERVEDVLDADVDVVVEVVGGLEPARTWHEAALDAGRPIVTANKQLIATHGRALLDRAAQRGVDLLFEAAVGGGIPVVRGLREGIAGDRLTTVSGILNGTCNYILTRMESAGLAFDAALAEAQAQGFAEADPTDDLEGYDARAKLCILARVGLGLDLSPLDVPCESIRSISDDDFVYARRLQATIRQVSRVALVDDAVQARVGPALVPLTSALARVIGSQNLIVAGGTYGRETTFAGYGAGGFPTAVAVVSDLLAIARRAGGTPAAWPATSEPASVVGSAGRALLPAAGRSRSTGHHRQPRLHLLEPQHQHRRRAAGTGRHQGAPALRHHARSVSDGSDGPGARRDPDTALPRHAAAVPAGPRMSLARPLATVVVPASTSNLGPGFDALGLALGLYLRAEVTAVTEDGAGQLRCTFSGRGPSGENLIVTGFRAICSARGAVQVPSLDVTVTCDIPACAGLGSSAAALVAGGRLAALVLDGVSTDDVIDVLTTIEGHPDNITAAVLGGLVAGCVDARGHVCVVAAALARRRAARDRDAATLVAHEDGACGPARARVAAGRHLQRAAHGAAAPGRRDRSARRVARSLLRSTAPAVSPVAGTRAGRGPRARRARHDRRLPLRRWPVGRGLCLRGSGPGHRRAALDLRDHRSRGRHSCPRRAPAGTLHAAGRVSRVRIQNVSTLIGLQCHVCHTAFAAEATYVCDQCFGPLEPVYDYDKARATFTRENIASRPRNLWRYRELLPITGEPLTGFGSGFTPLIPAPRLAARLGVRELYVKDDGVNHPTLSYKDRVVSVAATRAVELGFTVFGCASTGNLGNSVAAHASRLGLRCFVFIPDDLEPYKVLGSAIYHPTLLAVRGNYDDVNRLCTQVADKHGWGFANINLRSYYAEGAKTMGFEIVEQLGWRFPKHVDLAGGRRHAAAAHLPRLPRTASARAGRG